MQIRKEFVLRKVDGDYIILPVRQNAKEFNGLITVNEVGASLWKMLQEETSEEKLLQGLLNEYEVEAEVAEEDIQEFLDTLTENGILEEDAK